MTDKPRRAYFAARSHSFGWSQRGLLQGGQTLGRPSPFGAGRGRGATVDTCMRTTVAVIGTRV